MSILSLTGQEPALIIIDALAFADEMVADKQGNPSTYASVAVMYALAVLDDALAIPPSPGARVEALRLAVASRPKG